MRSSNWIDEGGRVLVRQVGCGVTTVVNEREYIFACILNELYKQTEYYNNHLTEHGFPLRQSPGFPVDPPHCLFYSYPDRV